MTATEETRREARDSVDASTLAAAVLAHIRSAPSTCDEVEVALRMSHQTASARVHELMRAGAIVAAGKRKTRSGRNAVVWQAVGIVPHLDEPALDASLEKARDEFAEWKRKICHESTDEPAEPEAKPWPKRLSAKERTLTHPGLGGEAPPKQRARAKSRRHVESVERHVRRTLGASCQCGAAVERVGLTGVRCSASPDCSLTETREGTAEELARLPAPEYLQPKAESARIQAAPPRQPSLFDFIGGDS